MSSQTIAVVLTCMDDRLHDPDAQIIQQLKKLLGVERVFVRTVAGPDGKIKQGGFGLDDIVADTQLIIDAKGASIVGVLPHCDCAGHPVSDEDHERDAIDAANVLLDALEFDGSVVPLIARQSTGVGPTWVIERLSVAHAAHAAA